jgi:hypothetical protein
MDIAIMRLEHVIVIRDIRDCDAKENRRTNAIFLHIGRTKANSSRQNASDDAIRN